MTPLNRCTVEQGDIKVTIEIKDSKLEQVLSAIEDCIKGLGFSFDGCLSVVEEEK